MKQQYISFINGIVVTTLLFAVLVLIQLIAYRQEIRWDFTGSGRFSLSRQSRDVLAMLDAPLTATAFYGEKDSNVSGIRELFREYQLAYPPFQFRIVNPAKNPEVAQQFDVKSHGTVILQYRRQQKKVIGVDEERLTNALYQLVDSRQKTIYFSQGHGEKGREQDGRLLWQALEDENYRVAPLFLNKTAHIPEDASCLVIAGPKTAFFDQEIEQIGTYLAHGGSVAIFLDPYHNGGLETFLRRYGIELFNLSIVDKVAKMPNGGDLFPAVSQYGSHQITRYLNKLTFFPVAQPIGIVDPLSDTNTANLLVQTELSSWGESDRQSLINSTARFDPDHDKSGPLPIGISVNISAANHQPTARMVVFGDSDFFSDDYLFMAGNRDLALNTLAWVAAREGYITVRSRNGGFTPIILSEQQQRMVFWLSLCLMPGLVLITGIWVRLRWMKK